MNVTESIKYIYPELVLLVFSLSLLILGLFVRKANLLGIFSLAGTILAFICLNKTDTGNLPLFFNQILNDSFAKFLKEIALIISSLVILISIGYKVFGEEDTGEYYSLLLLVTIAMMLAVSSNNLLMIYITFELISLISYILVGFIKRDVLSSEGALKYFLFGAFSTAIMLYGISFIYGLFGSTDLTVIQEALVKPSPNNFVVLIALILILAGLCFKCALVPFHMWAPDAYQGAPTPVTAFISVGPKAVGFAVLIRIFLKNFFPLFPGLLDLVMLVSIFSMTAGNIMALSQTNIKRMLGYSSIAQAGYILIGFIAGSPSGIKGALFYLLAYAFMNLGAFGCIVLISNSIGSDSIEDYAGLYKTDPLAASLMAVFLLSLAGIPPLAGFLGKFFVFAAAVEARFIFIVIAALINSVIAVYYYIRVIKYMYLEEPKIEVITQKPSVLKGALIIMVVCVLLLGLFPYPFLNLISASHF